MTYKPSKYTKIKINNDQGEDIVVEIVAEGEMALYLELHETRFEIAKDDSKIITYSMNYPENIETL